MSLLKLNLGCGGTRLEGFVNVDKYATGDGVLVCDLERFPWPWADASVGEVVLRHVLEHLGERAETFLGVMRELYRVCAHGARIDIAVPHPRHDDFLNDPTHVRAITPDTLEHFDMAKCLLWRSSGAANTPLALHLGVDFQILERQLVLDEPYWSRTQAQELTTAELMELLRDRNNVAREWRIKVQAVKPPRTSPGQTTPQGT